MKKIYTMIIFIVILTLHNSCFAESNFDLQVFERQKTSLLNGHPAMWRIDIDDMEQRGFISLNSDYDTKSYLYEGLYDIYVEVKPDVYLMNYGTSDFTPIPRIWLEFHSNSWLFADNAIFKIGDKTYTFDDISVDRSVDKYNSGIKEELVCICRDSEFMDAWINNPSTPGIKMRLKGEHDYLDFYVTLGSHINVRTMFQNFKDAGGLDYSY